jgi:hypothetical protein
MEGTMPITRLLQSSVFGPEEVREITSAFDGACQALGPVNGDDALVERIALAVIGAAERGARGREQIQRRALAILHSTEPSQSATAA